MKPLRSSSRMTGLLRCFYRLDKYSVNNQSAIKFFTFYIIGIQIIFRIFAPEFCKMTAMKRLIYPIMLMLCAVLYMSCENYETYGDKKAKERDAINRFIQEEGITVIDENQFQAQDMTTDLSKNEFVRLQRTGVYMQIVRKGCGDKLEENKSINILCRFSEYNILTDSLMLSNLDWFPIWNSQSQTYIDASQFVEKMNVMRVGTSFTATFVSQDNNVSLMARFHGSTSVPSGWLIPLNYVNVGRPENKDEETSRVRLIVPHSQGTADASSSVYPCYYEIIFKREK